MLDGPKPRFPSSVGVGTPNDGRKTVDDLKRAGVDFIKFQSLIPRDAVAMPVVLEVIEKLAHNRRRDMLDRHPIDWMTATCAGKWQKQG